ncbi:unnamed protein product [Schistosoma curassoni]|uniref:Uncharacterized protein n=1 Tax=Schistosoma curassoni TaxID=6186 RepID=A0A183JE47_9TREM|nr:unnamed protein product [Schistosoma curassoni]
MFVVYFSFELYPNNLYLNVLLQILKNIMKQMYPVVNLYEYDDHMH